MNKYSHKKGFTLVELVMTVIVVGIVAIPLSLLIRQHFLSAVQSSDGTAAMNLARLEMEKINNMDYDAINTFTNFNYNNYNFDVVRTVDFIQGDALSTESLKEIKVDVRRSGSPEIVYSLVTYLARNVNYGI